MSLFLFFGKFTPDALGKISAERTRKASEIVRALDGKIVAVYATLGEPDVVAVLELPGIAAAMKASIELSKFLGITFTTAPAITVEEFDRLVVK